MSDPNARDDRPTQPPPRRCSEIRLCPPPSAPPAGSPPGTLHGYVVGLIAHHLMAWSLPRGAGVVVVCGHATRGHAPELEFFRSARRAWNRAATGHDDWRPDLTVDVATDTRPRLARLAALARYAAARVPECWIVDPTRPAVDRFVLREGGYVVARCSTADERFRPASFRGIDIPLQTLWRLPPG